MIASRFSSGVMRGQPGRKRSPRGCAANQVKAKLRDPGDRHRPGQRQAHVPARRSARSIAAINIRFISTGTKLASVNRP